MATFFDKITSFEKVALNDKKGVDTAEFLKAAESLVSLFDLLDSSAFTIVQNDMNGNIKKIRDRLKERGELASTLEKLVLDEKSQKKTTATQGLLWLTRGLKFTAVAMRRSLNNPNEELTVSFAEAYTATLSKYHSMLVRPVFKLAMKAVPYRKDFYEKLGKDQEKVKQELSAWLDALEEIVSIIEAFYEQGNYGKGL